MLTVPGREVSVYPIRGGRLATLFLYKAQRAPADLSAEGARRELGIVYGGMGWIVPRLIEQGAHGPMYFDEVAQIEMPSRSLGQVTLVGDACQSVSLLAGQGVSMDVIGAYLLAEELGCAQGEEIAPVLQRYEQSLKPDIRKRQKAGRRFAQWLVPDSRTTAGTTGGRMETCAQATSLRDTQAPFRRRQHAQAVEGFAALPETAADGLGLLSLGHRPFVQRIRTLRLPVRDL